MNRANLSNKSVAAICLSLCAFFVGVFLYLSPESKDYRNRWMILAVGAMMGSIGLKLIADEFRRRIPAELGRAITALCLTVIFFTFGYIPLAAALKHPEGISGGLPLLPSSWNQAVGRWVFLCVGVLSISAAVISFVVGVRWLARYSRARLPSRSS